ncbi:MAG: hypothetical protein ACK5NG_08800 [Chthoniobacterales bacterium]
MNLQVFIAYIDPGTGSLILQALVAGVAGFLAFFRHHIFAFFRRKKSDDDELDFEKKDTSEESKNGEPDE